MIDQEVNLATQARDIMVGIIDDTHLVTHVHTEQSQPPPDHQQWMVAIKTNNGHVINFWMEGSVIHRAEDLIVHGRNLLGGNRVDAFGMLTRDQQNILTAIVMTAIAP